MLNIYVNTWGNYNENGAEGGQWITLPMDQEELENKLKEIAAKMGDHDPEWAIHDFEWTTDWEGREIGEMENIQSLNEYMQALDNLEMWEQELYSAAAEYWGFDYVDIENLEEYNLYPDIKNDYDLGYYWVEESGCYDLSSMGSLKNYIDYEAFGRDIRFESDGGFTSLGWIERR